MASIAASRLRLRQLEQAAHLAEKAAKLAEGAEYALERREEKRRRRRWADSSDEEEEEEEGDDDDDDDDDNDNSGDDEENNSASKRAKAAKEQEEFADEEEEGFDYEAKLARFQNETLRCKIEATEAYKAFVTKFETCVKADSLGSLAKLHDRMQAKLPVELRDMIYSYFRIQGRKLATNPTRHAPVQIHQRSYDPNFHIHERIKIDDDLDDARKVFETGSFDSLKPGGWLLNPEFVGHGMAREIAEIFYAVNSFNIQVYKLKEFLHFDRTQTGLKPYEYVRVNMTIAIPTTRCNGETERAWKTTENEVTFLNAIYEQLNQLTSITHKSEVSLAFWLSTSAPLWVPEEEGERRFYNIMESVRAPIYDLIHAGVSVTVKHNTMSTGKTQIISEEPLNYFRRSKNEWEAEKKSHGPDWMPSMNFISREALESRDEERREDTNRQLRELLKQRWGHVQSIEKRESLWPRSS